MGSTDIVQLLLDEGRADPGFHDSYALRWAATKGFADIADLLLGTGKADERKLKHVLDIAAALNQWHVVKRMTSLRQFGDIPKEPALLIAGRQNNKTFTRELLKHSEGLVVSPRCMQAAIKRNHTEIIDYFLAHPGTVVSYDDITACENEATKKKLVRHSVKRRWKQLRGIMHVNHCILEHVRDYYTPATASKPAGKGFLLSMEEFSSNISI